MCTNVNAERFQNNQWICCFNFMFACQVFYIHDTVNVKLSLNCGHHRDNLWLYYFCEKKVEKLMSAILIFVLYSVLPDTRICDLRDEIESQLNDEGIIPNDFVFLKSVGSRVTRVKYCHFIVAWDYMKQNYTTIHFRVVHNVLRFNHMPAEVYKFLQRISWK